jgi:hypothetical protein
MRRNSRRKRLAEMLPSVQRSAPRLFRANGYNSERAAKELCTTRVDVLDSWAENIDRRVQSLESKVAAGRADAMIPRRNPARKARRAG